MKTKGETYPQQPFDIERPSSHQSIVHICQKINNENLGKPINTSSKR